jgi:hypothetical protein
MKRINEVSVVKDDIKESAKSWRRWCGGVDYKQDCTCHER